MPSDHQINIQHVATLARLALTDDEAARYGSQLDGILTYIDTLAQYDLDGVEPTAHAMPVFDVMRPDESLPGFTQEQTLVNAPRRVGNQFQIPKVIE
jgi:aspartyl-tRNA(Asn)/glutamyl-tRNA(Gln) amidotransferase subunit C